MCLPFGKAASPSPYTGRTKTLTMNIIKSALQVAKGLPLLHIKIDRSSSSITSDGPMFLEFGEANIYHLCMKAAMTFPSRIFNEACTNIQ